MAMIDRDGIITSADYGLAYRTACLLLGDPAAAQVVVQLAFTRAGQAVGVVPLGEAGRPWLYRSLVRACRSSAAARTRSDRSSQPEMPADGVARDVLAALAALPDQLRVPLVLRFWTGLSEKGIAIAVDRRPSAVAGSLREARRQLGLDPRLPAWVVPPSEVSR